MTRRIGPRSSKRRLPLPGDDCGTPALLANEAMTETRQNLSQQVKGRRGRAIDKDWAHRMLLLRGGDTLSCRAVLRLEEVFALDGPTGTLQAIWKVH